ncbi:glycoside hydrolase family 75 protein [Streptomyces sp. NPDC059070]|uniref:glycoside hydrolase family 75 protein n=1 Tax=Streptomyces sp. NPDC059070 TaxID=3346713 RepID=UPI0036B63FB2
MPTRKLALAAACGAALLAAAVPPAARAADGPSGTDTGPVAAADLLARVKGCDQVSRGKYRTDRDSAATVPVCGTNGAVFWKADLDIDCDGRPGAVCNRATDPWFQNDTAFHQSDGRPLSAEELSYVVVPGASSLWNYGAAGIRGGGVAAVIYRDRVEYAVVGDTGPSKVIGEASYATAKALGMNPDPVSGGAASGVTYILFKDSQAKPIESHQQAVSLGDRLARRFLAEN